MTAGSGHTDVADTGASYSHEQTAFCAADRSATLETGDLAAQADVKRSIVNPILAGGECSLTTYTEK